MIQCEDFLKILKGKNLEINDLRLSDDDVHQNYDDEKEKITFTATREIIFDSQVNIGLSNYIRQIISEKDYDVVLTTYRSVVNIKEIHEQLINEAVLDSKRKATAIAESTGQKIVGIKSMDIKNYGSSYDKNYRESVHRIGEVTSKYTLSDTLNADYSDETEKVHVEWKIK